MNNEATGNTNYFSVYEHRKQQNPVNSSTKTSTIASNLNMIKTFQTAQDNLKQQKNKQVSLRDVKRGLKDGPIYKTQGATNTEHMLKNISSHKEYSSTIQHSSKRSLASHSEVLKSFGQINSQKQRPVNPTTAKHTFTKSRRDSVINSQEQITNINKEESPIKKLSPTKLDTDVTEQKPKKKKNSSKTSKTGKKTEKEKQKENENIHKLKLEIKVYLGIASKNINKILQDIKEDNNQPELSSKRGQSITRAQRPNTKRISSKIGDQKPMERDSTSVSRTLQNFQSSRNKKEADAVSHSDAMSIGSSRRFRAKGVRGSFRRSQVNQENQILNFNKNDQDQLGQNIQISSVSMSRNQVKRETDKDILRRYIASQQEFKDKKVSDEPTTHVRVYDFAATQGITATQKPRGAGLRDIDRERERESSVVKKALLKKQNTKEMKQLFGD